MDNSALVDFQPTEYVDISEEIEGKLELLAFHESQLVWLQDHDGNDVMENTRLFARVRGIQCGVKYAEGFRMCMVDHRFTTKRMLP
jgi:LmbE family N-acetylglucosaminyl deacetylase